MTTYRYKNETNADLSLVGIGIIEAGKTFESDVPVENPNLTYIETKSKQKPVNKEDGDGRA